MPSIDNRASIPVNLELPVKQLLNQVRSSVSDEHKLIPPLAQECFKQIQANKLGIGHSLQKYAAVSAVGLIGFGIPIGILYGLCVKPEIILKVLNLVNPSTAIVTVGSSIIVNETSRRLIGFNPAKELVRLTGSAITAITTAIAAATYQSYINQERKVEAVEEKLHGKLVENIKTLYDAASQHLLFVFEEQKRHENFNKISIFKDSIKELESNLHYVLRGLFKKYKISPPEKIEILSEFLRTVHTIKEFKQEFRIEEPEHNKKLFLQLPMKEFKASAVPDQVLFYLKTAESQQLGIKHTVVSYLQATTKGVVTTAMSMVGLSAITAASSYVAKLYKFPDSYTKFCDFPEVYQIVNKDIITPFLNGTILKKEPTAPLIVAIGLTALSLYAGYYTCTSSLNHSQAERKEFDNRVKKNVALAIAESTSIYDGIALELKKHSREDLNSEKLIRKIKEIEAQLRQSPFIENPEDITKYLRSAVER
jgi:hypothetical protein